MGARSGEPRRGLRITAAVLVVAAMAALFSLVLGTAWVNVSSQYTFVSDERAGVAYLKPLTTLIQALSVAESAAVHGQRVDTGGLTAAAKDVDELDARYGATLGTSGRWADLQKRIAALVAKPGSGSGAYQNFSDTIGLAIDLAGAVGDSSNLILDPDLDAYYLMDVGLLRLPTVMLNAARAADLLALSPATPPASDSGGGTSGTSGDGSAGAAGGGSDGALSGARGTAVALARYQVALAAAAVTISLKKSVGATARSSLGTDLTAQQDAFQGAVDALTPPAVVQQPDAAISARAIAEANARVQTTALALANAVWGQLDGLLADRQKRLATQRGLMIAGTAGVLLLAVALLWLLAPARRASASDTDGDDETEPEAPQIALIEARDLLGTEELVHVGRGVRHRAQENDGAE